MEAVDEAPGEVGREGLEASIAKHFEQCRHHQLDSSAGLLWIGHIELFGFIDGGELGALVMLHESALVDRAAILISGFCGDEAGKVCEICERLVHVSLHGMLMSHLLG